jgi:hypothetical protein
MRLGEMKYQFAPSRVWGWRAKQTPNEFTLNKVSFEITKITTS